MLSVIPNRRGYFGLNKERASELSAVAYITARSGYAIDLVQQKRCIVETSFGGAVLGTSVSMAGLTNLTIAFWLTDYTSDPGGGSWVGDANLGGVTFRNGAGVAGNVAYWGHGSAADSTFMERDRIFFRGNAGTNQSWTGFVDPIPTNIVQTHIGIVRTLTTIALYKNGIQIDSTSLSGEAIAASTGTYGVVLLAEESGSGSSGGGVRGDMPEWLLCSRALTANEMWSLYAPPTRNSLYWQPSNRAYAFFSSAAAAAGYLLVKN
jgi:hypothetical protein